MKNLNQFSKKYSLQKTLQFELIPQGETSDFINQRGIISKDEELAKSYKKMKFTIDEFHKYFIELAMTNVELTQLDEFSDLYWSSPEIKKGEKYKKQLEEVQTNLRKEIVQGFNSEEAKEIFSKIDKKELITEILDKWIASYKPDLYFDENFKKFTTYFYGFHENRKNIYTDKPHSTGIAFRLVHENLPKFLDNIKIFERIKTVPELYNDILKIPNIDKVFTLSYYNEVLTQKQIDFVYNTIIGGSSEGEGERKIQGLNEYINLYNQKQKDKKDRIPKLKKLYKQILSDKVSSSFLPDKFNNSQEVLDTIRDYYLGNLRNYKSGVKEEITDILIQLRTLLADLKDYDLNKIYLRNDTRLTSLSQKIFGSYTVFENALGYYFENSLNKNFLSEYKSASDKKKEKLEKGKEHFIKQTFISINQLQQALDNYIPTLDESLEIRKRYNSNCIADYFHNHFLAEKKEYSEKDFNFIANIEAKYSCIKGILNENYPVDKKLNQDKQSGDNIKLFLDSLMEMFHFIKPLALPRESTLEKDELFYGQFETYYEQFSLLLPLYNKVRNFVVQKPYHTEKIKLNFENSQLLGGWDANKEKDYLTTIFRRNGEYYLGIIDKNHKKIFEDIEKHQKGECYDKMFYKLLPGINKMLPKVFFAKKNIDYYKPSIQLLENYNNGTHKKGDNFSLKDCHRLIDFFKSSINMHEDWSQFNFKFAPTESYKDISYFYKEVNDQGYKIEFHKISTSYIDSLVEEGKIYLFKIYNKDFSSYSKGKPNLHTMYWRALFDENNLKDVVYKLNGQAEIFFRKKSIDEENIVIHGANKPIENKNPEKKKDKSVFEYDIIKDKRYTVDKIHFHVPITLNFKATGKDNINQDALEHLRNNPEISIIGVDRGERHLIYLTLINQKGEILKQESLNTILNDNYPIATPYHKLLSIKEDGRANARKNWGVIENIKELKEGYISQVVHKIAQMMLDHKAILVMEDLNFGFKRGRFKVEKQVYQKLEKMLIDKLNYLVFKDRLPNEPGGLMNALQLTSKFESFKEMGKQSGFLFYVPAWNTSKIDPTTGFVNLFHAKYENIDKARLFIENFQQIQYNAEKDYFEFMFDYSRFTAKAEDTKTNWTVCTHGDRVITFRNSEKQNHWDNKTVILTEVFKDLFVKVGIDYKADNLQNQILSKSEKSFYEDFLRLFNLTLQMRNSVADTEIDYMISPVMNRMGFFYDSRTAGNNLPIDADANGAYHIAKKGLWILEQINNTEDGQIPNLKTISNKEWLQFVQN